MTTSTTPVPLEPLTKENDMSHRQLLVTSLLVLAVGLLGFLILGNYYVAVGSIVALLLLGGVAIGRRGTRER